MGYNFLYHQFRYLQFRKVMLLTRSRINQTSSVYITRKFHLDPLFSKSPTLGIRHPRECFSEHVYLNLFQSKVNRHRPTLFSSYSIADTLLHLPYYYLFKYITLNGSQDLYSMKYICARTTRILEDKVS